MLFALAHNTNWGKRRQRTLGAGCARAHAFTGPSCIELAAGAISLLERFDMC